MEKIFNKKSIVAFLIIYSMCFACVLGLRSVSNYSDNYEKEADTYEEEKIEICDGTSITRDCSIDGVEYSVYKYYPAEPERSHVETITTYTKEIVGYCTLCNDGTRSPSCATGRGACSHHGGVAEWNAPIYSDVPHYEYVTVIDAEAIPERWEKIEK